jgi:hypothetical protein
MKHIEKFQNFKTISESLKYHIDNDLSLCESVYRVESDAWLDLIIEARDLYKDGKIELSDYEKQIKDENGLINLNQELIRS